MTRQGWTYDAEYDEYSARGPAVPDGSHGISLLVRRHTHDRQWMADVGWTGCSFATFQRYPTPELAADEAEAWLRGMLSQFAFPWLEVRLQPTIITHDQDKQ